MAHVCASERPQLPSLTSSSSIKSSPSLRKSWPPNTPGRSPHIVTNKKPIPLIRNNFVSRKLEVGLTNPALERPLFHERDRAERQGETQGGGSKHPSEYRSDVGAALSDVGRKRFDGRLSQHRFGQSAEQDRAEGRDDQRTAERAEEVHGAGCGPHLMRHDGVLDRNHGDRQESAKPHAGQGEKNFEDQERKA